MTRDKYLRHDKHLANNNNYYFKSVSGGTQSKLFVDCGFARTAIRELSQTIYVNAKGKKCIKNLTYSVERTGFKLSSLLLRSMKHTTV